MNKTADDHLFFPDTKYIEICMFSSIKDRFPAMIIISLRQTLGYSYEELQWWKNLSGHLPS